MATCLVNKKNTINYTLGQPSFGTPWALLQILFNQLICLNGNQCILSLGDSCIIIEPLIGPISVCMASILLTFLIVRNTTILPIGLPLGTNPTSKTAIPSSVHGGSKSGERGSKRSRPAVSEHGNNGDDHDHDPKRRQNASYHPVLTMRSVETIRQ